MVQRLAVIFWAYFSVTLDTGVHVVRRLILTGVCSFLIFGTASVWSQDSVLEVKPNGSVQQSKPSDLIGSWKFVSGKYGGQAVQFGNVVEIKHVTDSQFTWLRYDGTTKTLTEAGGGHYSVKGEVYSEQVEYGLGKNFEAVRGQLHSFHWKIDGNKWYSDGQLANGLTIEEVWEKMLPEPDNH